MDKINQLISDNISIILISMIAVILILFIFIMVLINSNRKLNKKDLEYRKYLISKLQRLSKEYLRSCGIRNKYKLEKILRKYYFEYHIKTYFKFFNFSNIAV